jgi:hypothetical protein
MTRRNQDAWRSSPKMLICLGAEGWYEELGFFSQSCTPNKIDGEIYHGGWLC